MFIGITMVAKKIIRLKRQVREALNIPQRLLILREPLKLMSLKEVHAVVHMSAIRNALRVKKRLRRKQLLKYRLLRITPIQILLREPVRR